MAKPTRRNIRTVTGKNSAAVVTGATKVVNRLHTIRAAAAVALTGNGLQRLLLDRTKARFLRQVDPNNEKWKPLSPVTADDKASRGKRPEILQRSGVLYESLAIVKRNQTNLASPTGAGFSIGVISSSRGEYGKDPSIYGRRHQFGEGVKQRRFLGMGAADIKAVDGLLRREIVKKAGLR